MTAIIAMQVPTSLLTNLLEPAMRAMALAGMAGLALTALRVKTVSLRLLTWTTVLYAALAMPLLGRMLPQLAVPAPAFLQYETSQVNVQVAELRPIAADSAPLVTGSSVRVTEKSASRGLAPSLVPLTPYSQVGASISWNALAAGIYLAVSVVFLARLFVGLAFNRRLMRSSQTICELRVTQRIASRARSAGSHAVPRVAESELISVPLTLGALRSMILLPCGWREWDDTQLDAVIAHEISHVVRRDALTLRLSLIHRAIFWFSPLAWWLDRHLADLAEQASDEAALSSGADRSHYAKTLLGFFEALHASPGRVWWQGVSMAKAGQAEQRLERILAWKGSTVMQFKKSITAAVIALAVPVVYLAASAHPVSHVAGLPGVEVGQQPTGSTPVAPTPAPPSPTELRPAPEPPAVAPMAAVTRYAAVPAIAPISSIVRTDMHVQSSNTTTTSSGKGYSYSYGEDDGQRFVIVTGKSDSLTMSGSQEDARHVEKLRKHMPGDFIWFERDEKSYVIRDQATIDHARKLWAPQEELGRKQEELGKQQEALGKQQEELGARMEQVHVKVPDMTVQLDKLKAELKELNSSATTDQIGNIQSEIGELQSKIGEIQSQAGDQQGKLGEEMGALGEKQGKLGEEQGKLGEEQGKLAREATREMKQILDEAITKGTAQPEP